VAPRLAFLALVAIELAHMAAAILQHRVPATHDGFQYFTVQYFFLNNAIQGGGVAQWIPYMSQGTVAAVWYAVQGSFLQNALIPAGPLLRDVDLLTIFHLGMFVDEMILLAGTWLLARRFFGPATVCFIAVSVVGSCVWLDQPYWNFRLYYALPMVIELGHRFIETGRWRWFFLAANLLALQVIGNLPYFIPVASFAVFIYFAGFAAFHHQQITERIRTLRPNGPAVAAILSSAASFAVVYACLVIGTSDLVTYSAGRSPDGSTTLNGFLTYGGEAGLQQWLDLLLNVSPSLDMTLYGGILLLPLALAGLFAVDRRRAHFVVLATVMLLFTLGTLVAIAAFTVWPGMRFFRHIALVSPFVKVLVVFVAGIGFERIFDVRPERALDSARARALVRAAGLGAAIVLLGGASLAVNLARSPGTQLLYMDPDPAIDRPDHMYEPALVARRLHASAALAIAGAVVVGAAGFAPRRLRVVLLAIVLGFVGYDVYRFKFNHLVTRSDAVPPTARIVVRPAPMTFPRRRDPEVRAALLTSGRLRSTLTFHHTLRRSLQGEVTRGTQYWTNHAFLFTDEAGSSFRMDSWLRPIDQLMKMYWGAPLEDASALPPEIDLGHMRFPVDRPGAGEVAGVTADKIRFFASAYAVGSPADLVPLMTDGSYAGNVLFVLPLEGPLASNFPQDNDPQRAARWASERPLSADESRPLQYQVTRFDANTLTMKVNNPGKAASWMYYADAWHPSWKASVNGRMVPVYRANMAYKAIPIEGGENLVEFRFGSRLFSVLSAIVSLNAAFWLAAVGVIGGNAIIADLHHKGH
jgi:hypothetical protein